MKNLPIMLLVAVMGSGCFEPRLCEITETDAGSLIECPDGEVLTKDVAPGAKCFSETGKIVCDDGNEFEISADGGMVSVEPEVGAVTAPDTGFDADTDIPSEPGDPSTCAVLTTEIRCGDGATAERGSVPSTAVCSSQPEPGLGRRIVCEFGGQALVLIPTLGSVDGVEPTCEVQAGGELVSCSDGTAFPVASLAGCPVAQVSVSLDADEAVSVACGGSAILLIPKADYCRDVVIDSDESMDAFVNRRCLYVYGDLTIQGVTGVRLDELFVVLVSGTLALVDVKSTELLPSMLSVGALVVRDNENLKGFGIGSFRGQPNSFYIKRTLEITNNKKLQVVDVSNVRRIGESWVTSGNKSLEYIKLPTLLNHRLEVFMCVDNENLPRCEVARVWDWGESHAQASYIGNNGNAQCH